MELHAALGFDAIAHGDDNVKIKVLDLSFYLTSSFHLNCCKICNSC